MLPSATGTLAATPLAHALVYSKNRRLTGRLDLAGPARQIRALDLVEWHRQRGAIKRKLDELPVHASSLRFRANPL